MRSWKLCKLFHAQLQACKKIQFFTQFLFYSFDQSQVLTLHTNLKVFPNSVLDAHGVHRKISQRTFHRFQPRVIWSIVLKIISLQSWLPTLISFRESFFQAVCSGMSRNTQESMCFFSPTSTIN